MAICSNDKCTNESAGGSSGWCKDCIESWNYHTDVYESYRKKPWDERKVRSYGRQKKQLIIQE